MDPFASLRAKGEPSHPSWSSVDLRSQNNSNMDTSDQKNNPAPRSSDWQNAQPEERAPPDFLEYLLWVRTEQQRVDCFRNAMLMLDKVLEIFPQLDTFCSYVYRQIDEFQDIDFAHLMLFLVIPQIEPITREIRQATPPDRFNRFLDYLLYCRTNLTSGLTKTQDKCSNSSQVHFSSLRAFVWDVRSFYLKNTTFIKSSSSSSSSSDISTSMMQDTTKIAQWNRPNAHSFKAEVGTGFFKVMALHLQAAFAEEFTDFPVPKQPFYGKETGVVITTTTTTPATDHKEDARSQDLATHPPSLMRGADSSIRRIHPLFVRIARPPKFPAKFFRSSPWTVQLLPLANSES